MKIEIDVNSFNGFPITENMPKGDMPGDKVLIGEDHINKANTIFKLLAKKLEEYDDKKIVLSVFGGSGVGKSEIASLLAHYFTCANHKAYVISGDNYPYRIPLYNDAERMAIFRSNGLKGLLANNAYSKEVQAVLDDLWVKETDSDPKMAEEYPWLKFYQEAGRKALAGYLGTPNEQDFVQINGIITDFKKGNEKIWLKRMGRSEEERFYDCIDFSDIDILIIEWTHGGNYALNGIDVPIMLNSTVEETREHRRLRARDGKVDSAFTTMVLEIEQALLESQKDHAKIIIAKNGEVIK